MSETPARAPSETFADHDPGASDHHDALAMWFVAPGEIDLRAEPVDPPGAAEISVRAITSLVSSGTEMNVYRGRAGSDAAVALPMTRGTYPFPLKFGYQIVGEVMEAGKHTEFSVGEHVFASHPHQERFVIAADPGLVRPVHADVSPDQAAFTNLFTVAYTALLDTPVHIGDVVVVSGLGVIGTFVAHLCRETAGKVILIDPIPQRRERAAWLGADAIVSPEDAPAAVAEFSHGRGSDLWFEASGAPAALQSAIDNTGQEGTITVLSFYGDRPVTLQLGQQFHFRRQRIVSSQVSSVGSALQPRWDKARRYENAASRLAGLDVERLISHRLPFTEAPDAYRLIDQNADETLAVMLDYAPSWAARNGSS